MSDRYLCKAKRTDNGEWVEGYYCKRKTGYYDNIGFHEEYKDCIIVSFSDGGITWVDVDSSTLCQCTGLPDKKGRKIWENDIVRYQFDNGDCPFPNKHTEKIIGQIFFSDFQASFSVTAGRICSSMINNDLYNYVQNGNRVECIGNIFDNPELLGGD